MTALSVGLGVLVLTTFAAARSNEAATAAGPPVSAPAPIAGRAAVRPAAPVIPAQVVAALQEGKYDAARSSLAALRGEAKERDDRAYLGYLQAIAERLAGQKDAARATLRAAPRRESRRAPGSPRSVSSSRASSSPRATWRRPRNWPGPRPSGCCPMIARTGWRRSTTPSPGGCSSPRTR